MPKIDLDQENKASLFTEYPKLWLKKGETAKILCYETAPEMEYVHTFRALELDDDGKPVKELVASRNGGREQKDKYNFVGRYICHGDYQQIHERGADPKHCKACEAATQTDAVDRPQRRFAMHVVKYGLKSGSSSFELASPFTAELVAWTFGDNIFNTLSDFRAEWDDLKKHDLKLGPCEVENFQRFEIKIAANADWLVSEERKALVEEVYANNQCKDLSYLIARKVDQATMEEAVDKCVSAHKRAYGRADEAEQESAAKTVDIDDIIGRPFTEESTGKFDETPVLDPDAAPVGFDELSKLIE